MASRNWMNAFLMVFTNKPKQNFADKSDILTTKHYLSYMLNLDLIPDDKYYEDDFAEAAVPESIWAALGSALVKNGSWKAPFRVIQALSSGIINSFRMIAEVLPLWASLFFESLNDATFKKQSQDKRLTTQPSYFKEESLVEKEKNDAQSAEPKVFFIILQSIFFLIYLAGRAITAPRVSLAKAWLYGTGQDRKKLEGEEPGSTFYGVVLVGASFLFTTAMYIILFPFVIKALAFAAPKALVSLVNTFTIFLASQSGVFGQLGNLIANAFGPLTNGLGLNITSTLWLYAGAVATALNLGFVLRLGYLVFKANHNSGKQLPDAWKKTPVIHTMKFEDKDTSKPAQKNWFQGIKDRLSSKKVPNEFVVMENNDEENDFESDAESVKSESSHEQSLDRKTKVIPVPPARPHAETGTGTYVRMQDPNDNYTSDTDDNYNVSEFVEYDYQDQSVSDDHSTARGHAGTQTGTMDKLFIDEQLRQQGSNIQSGLDNTENTTSRVEEAVQQLQSPVSVSNSYPATFEDDGLYEHSFSNRSSVQLNNG